MKRTEKQKRALEELYRVADQAPDDLLHMNAVVRKGTCGTARCLLGWMIVDPWFRYNSFIGELPLDFDSAHFPQMATTLKLKKLLGLGSKDEADTLFAGTANPHFTDGHAISKAEVLAAIKTVQKGKKLLPYRALRWDE